VGVQSRDNRTWSHPIDAIDGGYFLASFNPASPPDEDEDWIPTVFPENPGDVLADGPAANINILNDVDERVLLLCILLNRTPTEREIQSRIDQGDHLATFTLDAVGPVHVLSNDLEEQVTLAPWLTTPIRLDCFISMKIEKPEFVEPGEPAEQHHLRMWPADGVPRVTPWWMY
jgi:hypothetical protein